MISSIQNMVRSADAFIARAYLNLFEEKCGLLGFLFHSLFRDEGEIDLNLIDPLERTTVAMFRQLVKYYIEHGYQFVSPDQVTAGLSPEGRYAVITFDDGYYNNTLALPVLEEFGVPAVFFVTTEHVRENKCFWWDVLFREMTARGASRQLIYRESLKLKAKRNDQIEAELSARFGPDAFTPRGEIDRPFNPEELREFASHPLVHIGNHTVSHAILTNYSEEDVRRQVTDAQEWLTTITGQRPQVIAYPNGAHSGEIARTCDELGLKVGFTIRPQKNRLPLEHTPDRLLRLGRFTPHANDTIVNQCRTYRSDFQLYATFREGYLRLLRGQPSQ